MQNKTSLFESKFVFRGPEGPKGDAAAKKHTEGPRTAAERSGIMVDHDHGGQEQYKSYGEWVVAQAEVAAKERGEQMTQAQIDEIRLAGKLLLSKLSSQARDLSQHCFNGAPVFPCMEDGVVIEALSKQGETLNALGIEMGSDVKGLFPRLESGKMKQGEFLVVLDGGARTQIVSLSKEADETGIIVGPEDITVVAEGKRNEQVYAGIMKIKDRFTLASSGRIEFKNPIAERKTTLGQMFTQEALVVDGKLAVKGPDDEYHRVIEKRGGKIVELERKRVIVKTGTEVKREIEEPKYVAIVKKFRGDEQVEA